MTYFENLNRKSMVLDTGETYAYYDNEVSGVPVFVLLHGNMSSGAFFDVLYNDYKDNIRLICPDLRGFGNSTYNNRFDSLNDLAADVIDFTKKLNLDKYAVGGWSTGGGVAIYVAASEKDSVTKMVLIESVGSKGYPILRKDENFAPIPGDFLLTKDEIASDPIQVAPAVKAFESGDRVTIKAIWDAAIFNEHSPDETRYELYLDEILKEKCLVDVDYALVHFNVSDEHNGIDEGDCTIGKVDCETLIIQGNKDLVVPMDMAEQLKSGLKHSEMTSGDWGHSPFIYKDDSVIKKIFSFVTK